MSRNFTPKQFDIMIKEYNMPPQSAIQLVQNVGDKVMNVFPDDEQQFLQSYPRLGAFGASMLLACYNIGLTQSDNGKKILQMVEDHFNGIDIKNEELAHNAQLWYEGQFAPGYYMNDNDSEFAQYLKSLANKPYIK